MKKYLLTFFLLSTNFLYASEHEHLKNVKTIADSFAWAKNLNSVEQSIWPFALKSIGHSMQSYQNYSFSPYWHDGLDIRGEAGQQVFSTVSGKVVNIENYQRGNDLYWEVAILDDSGFVWKYHHMDKNSIADVIKEAYKTGERIKQGEYIGDIVTWPATSFGERYHHIHLLVVDGNKRYVNPFTLLPKLEDTSAPQITEIGLFDNKRKMISGTTTSSEHGIYIVAQDLVLHDQFILTPYLITYSLDNGADQTVWRFDYLPSVDNDTDYINDFYLKKTCGNYSCRKFYINLNFDKNAKDATKFFDLSPGIHEIKVTVSDFVGNQSQKNFQYNVR